MFSKNETTLYQKTNNNIAYVSIKKQANYEVVIIKGNLGQEPKFEILKFSSKSEVDVFSETTFKQYSLSHTFQPNYIPKKIGFNFWKIENQEIFKEVIIGNENSQVAELINKLNISDWVKKGKEFN